jgi:hypothetical protein
MANLSVTRGSANVSRRWGLLLASLLGVGCGGEAAEVEMTAAKRAAAPLEERGAVSCDFEFSPTVNPATIAPTIERDRTYMAARPGFQEKHIPFNPPVLMLPAQTGGRYLFDSYQLARDYLTWAQQEFVLDGVHFFDRTDFVGPVCHVWQVVGAWEGGDPRTSHHYIRTERMRGPANKTPAQLRAQLGHRWTGMRNQAEHRGLSGVRLMFSPDERLIEIVYLASREVHGMLGLQSLISLGLPLLEEGSTRVFDRTQFVLTMWFPFVTGDQGEPAPFPNSPPLPAPYCTDGVCEVNRGETQATCPVDCPVHCGDATCQPGEGESTANCPSDCRI